MLGEKRALNEDLRDCAGETSVLLVDPRSLDGERDETRLSRLRALMLEMVRE